jgi:hypothetical protein
MPPTSEVKPLYPAIRRMWPDHEPETIARLLHIGVSTVRTAGRAMQLPSRNGGPPLGGGQFEPPPDFKATP